MVGNRSDRKKVSGTVVRIFGGADPKSFGGADPKSAAVTSPSLQGQVAGRAIWRIPTRQISKSQFYYEAGDVVKFNSAGLKLALFHETEPFPPRLVSRSVFPGVFVYDLGHTIRSRGFVVGFHRLFELTGICAEGEFPGFPHLNTPRRSFVQPQSRAPLPTLGRRVDFELTRTTPR
jgi:hypothetical protein